MNPNPAATTVAAIELTELVKTFKGARGERVRAVSGIDLRIESGEVVVELQKGDALTVTGAPVVGGDYQWYPVTGDSSGQAGYIATNFMTPPG